jgi:hypothetical protein
MKPFTVVAGLILGTIWALACAKGPDARDSGSRPASPKTSEAADTAPAATASSSRARSVRDVCGLLSAGEILEITGVAVERVEKKPNGCEWYANAAAQQQKGADTARATLEKLNKEEPKSAGDLTHTMENLLKGVGGAVAPDKPLFAVIIQWEDADVGEAMLKGTVAVNGAGTPGGALEPVEGLGDRAFIGAMGMLFYVRKGAALITIGGMGTREQTIALARKIVPRI